jgi:hypothetical protein
MNPMPKKMQTLVAKLAQIMADTPWVEKKGRNSFFNYDYAKESDILDAIREKLAAHGIFVFTSIESMDFRETPKRTRDGSPVNLVFVRTKHTFSDGESGESVEVHGYGSGEDSGDKAIYKAITGAMKYFVSKNFLMSTGDDPEKDDEKESKSAAPAPLSGIQEEAAFSPAPPYRGKREPESAPLVGTGSESPIRDQVKEIQSKSGPKKDGTTYTRYSIETQRNGFFTTFNPAFADIAMDAKSSGQDVVIRYRANGRWKDVEDIRLASGQAAEILEEVESLPF